MKSWQSGSIYSSKAFPVVSIMLRMGCARLWLAAEWLSPPTKRQHESLPLVKFMTKQYSPHYSFLIKSVQCLAQLNQNIQVRKSYHWQITKKKKSVWRQIEITISCLTILYIYIFLSIISHFKLNNLIHIKQQMHSMVADSCGKTIFKLW